MWNTEKCLNSDSGPLANMSRWPAGLMLYPAASPCTAREPQQTCLDITQLTWPIILSHVPNKIGRMGGILCVLSLASSSQKVTESADPSLKPKKQALHWSNWKTRELPMQRATRLVQSDERANFLTTLSCRSMAIHQRIERLKWQKHGQLTEAPYSPRKKSKQTWPKVVNLIGQIFDFN